jgi:hypothetical protein
MDGESEADTQRAEAGRAEANVKREGRAVTSRRALKAASVR